MMKYPKEYLEEIKLRLKVSQVVGKYVNLKKRGKEFVGLSPFKNEKTPSFTINDEKGFYHCFSSGEHGNIFDFIMKTKSMGFGEAVKSLAVEAGMQPFRFTPQDKEKELRFKNYKEIYKKYSDFFFKQLFNKENKFALEYLEKRGVKENIIKEFKIGYVPKNNKFFNQLFKEFKIDEIEKTGLYYKIENSNQYIDRFKNRIIFPVQNYADNIIAFGGRILNNDKLAKYINSPETEFYKKGSQLFNLNRAKDERPHTDELVIVEGYMDVLALYSNNIKNVVSNSGTALTEKQIEIIWRYFSNPIISMDGDMSGQKAALRIAERLIPFITENNKLFFSILNEGEDPDDVIKKSGKEAFLKVLSAKKIIQEFIWDSYLKKIDNNNPFEVSKFEKQIRYLCYQIKDETLKKYILEDFLKKIDEFTPNTNFIKKSSYKTRFKSKVLNETKKIYLKNKSYTKEDIVQFSILFIMIYYSPAIRNKIDKLKGIKFISDECEALKDVIIEKISSNVKEKEILDLMKDRFINLLEKINSNSNLNTILGKKNFSQISEFLDDLIYDLEELNHKRKIESLEKKLINSMDENAYRELIKLKSPVNRE
tara:strand:+ start:2297 stop:4078 length:1782 start_codon:yes stop_codon:yes gene_type:complete